jgi:NAD(P)-dependent dehydrogenase (short-subunit alcohol dehydrogenase family)
MAELQNKVALITGASGSLGGAVARRFLAAGARLVLIDHDKGRLSALFPELEASDEHILIDAIDAGNLDLMRWAVEQTLQHFDRLDVLVNTVGSYKAGHPLHETPLQTWEAMIDSNARSVFVACQAAIPAMLEQRYGKIINVASRSGLAGAARSAAYSAAKAAVIRLTESMAAELKNDGINVNCVVPGTIDNPRNRAEMPKSDPSRWVAAESLAEVILFLASDAARDIHGAAIPVYGRS